MSEETAILGGGCFWGVEEILRKIPGVIATEVGYCGGQIPNPSYEDLKTGRSGYAEVVKISFQNTEISFDEILDYFFRLHDPTTLNRQENDIGTQYRSVIFCQSEAQKEIAEKKKHQVEVSGKWSRPIVTEIATAKPYYRAEDYHQSYLQRNPAGYNCHYLRS